MQVRRHPFQLALIGSALVATLATACNDDGRDMREPLLPPPAPTTLPPSTVPPGEGLATVATTTLAPSFQLVLPWPNGAAIPERHTCDGEDLAPALSWTAVPVDTVELAVTMTDLDVGFTHWIMTAVSPTRMALAEGEVPVGAKQWTNDFGDAAYGGPCPPADSAAHTYLFTVHALNQQLEVADDASATEVISILNQTAILQSSVSGTYARSG
jgi:Raf kinase inhibitor-like YbhB/YbcL family protein